MNCHDVIRDDTGIEVADLASAEAQACKAIQELRQENDQSDGMWEGWQLNVTDASGRMLLSILLKMPLQ